MSDSGSLALVNGPESRFVVEAIDAVLRGDVDHARDVLVDAADLVGWPAVAHRIDVAGRALTADAGFSEDHVPDEIDLVPEVIASTVSDSESGASALIARWCRGHETIADLPNDDVLPSLALVAWLIDRAGYPAEVVV